MSMDAVRRLPDSSEVIRQPSGFVHCTVCALAHWVCARQLAPLGHSPQFAQDVPDLAVAESTLPQRSGTDLVRSTRGFMTRHPHIPYRWTGDSFAALVESLDLEQFWIVEGPETLDRAVVPEAQDSAAARLQEATGSVEEAALACDQAHSRGRLFGFSDLFPGVV
jgi:hypothetical protein